MVWIHGGAMIYGDGGATYNPERLVKEGVIVVTLNYRLGALGFMAHPELTAESGSNNSGNYGLMDQQAALAWVKKYIRDFGGNPDNVTIFGESAGGHSVLSQVAAPSSAGLFNKAIVQSGSYVADQIPLATAELIGTGISAVAGCFTPGNVAACLRGLTAEQLLTAQGDSFFMPTAGTGFLPNSIAQAFATGNFNAVPTIVGANRDEGTLFTALDGPFFDEASYRAGVVEFFATAPVLNANQIATDYLARVQGTDPVNPYTTYNLAYSAIYTDSFFTCTAIPQLSALAAQTATYGYHFTDRNSFNQYGSVLPYPMGASHTNEIQYVLNDAATFTALNTHEGALELSEAMIDYWTNFAKMGDPNGGDLPYCDSFAVYGSMMNLNNVGPTPSNLLEYAVDHNCNYWAAPPLSL
jgi:para-nitrobenzyl esterase